MGVTVNTVLLKELLPFVVTRLALQFTRVPTLGVYPVSMVTTTVSPTVTFWEPEAEPDRMFEVRLYVVMPTLYNNYQKLSRIFFKLVMRRNGLGKSFLTPFWFMTFYKSSTCGGAQRGAL